ncbi:DUF47 domain-containing protein [Paenibacillus turpanensis]|uniref:DUF47 domain-containing protein n=1 Tax=Paenibacillus turpanensis TaxID=2689078 RepID=UPI0014089788|nr:DUF47 family protein [Paenibacillus turpanensis]
MAIFGKTNDEEFILLLLKAADNLMHAAHEFRAAMTSGNPPASYFPTIVEYERKGDQLTQQLLSGLSTVQTAPIGRDSLMELAQCIDDVLDGIEAAMARFDYLDIGFSDKIMQQFSALIVSCCHHLVEAFKLLSAKKYIQMRENTVEINKLEHEADILMREGIRSIFLSKSDPYHDFKLKELYERLEETTDRCEDAADVLQAIILKHS